MKEFVERSSEIVCAKCGEHFKAYPCEIKKGRRFCSGKCAHEAGSTGRRNSHGQYRTRLYGLWCGMKNRCASQRGLAGEYYMSRGISVCEEWTERFEAFRDWAVANGYRDHLELDRKDVNGNYEPSNCRWATRTQQMCNTRKRANAKTSRFKGVSLNATSRLWTTQLCRPGHSRYVGRFATALLAALAYDSAAILHFGEYARINFPERQGASR